MKRMHVFNAGPCLLPQEVYDSAIGAIRDFAGTGVSVLSVSHRSREWVDFMEETRALWKELLDIPDTHEVVFLSGGARMSFLFVALNYLERKAAYLDTGVWAHSALEVASGIGNAYAIASSSDRNYNYIPRDFTVPGDLDYLHITSNNTIYGTQMRAEPDSPVPLIADMSSDILSRRVDVSRYALIYGGAQKNAGAAGATFAIIRKDSLGKVSRRIPEILDYRTHIVKGSMYNTPPVFPIYVMHETLKWLRSTGGIGQAEKRNAIKAEALYAEIDRNPFFRGTANRQDRSLMNVCFVMEQGYENLQDEFLSLAGARSIVGIKGHRSVGGFRASIYNACTLEDVQALVDCMKEFETMHSF